jgi:CelD/BcsL family acetyltransferase involved in cellulose biosynthesis
MFDRPGRCAQPGKVADRGRAVTNATTGLALRGLRLNPGAVDAAGLAAWRDLADRAAEPNPFFRPEFLLANVIERGLSVALLVVMDGPRWVACLPVRSQRPTPRFPLSSITALTDQYNFSGLPLLDRDSPDAAADALIALVRTERRAVVLLIGVFESNGPVGRALARAAARSGTRLTKLASFQRGGWRRMSERHFPGPAVHASERRKLARRARLLAAELGGELAVVDRTHDPAAWEEFLAMENLGWKADLGTAMGSTAGDTAFFRRMCAGMSAVGCLELVSLEVAGRSVAMECHLIDGPALWSFKIAHNPAYAWFSPGTQLKYRVLDGLYDRAIDLADSCAVPENAHSNRLWPDRRTMDTVMLPTGSPVARLVPSILWGRSVARKVLDRIAQRRARRATAPLDIPAGRAGDPGQA